MTASPQILELAFDAFCLLAILRGIRTGALHPRWCTPRLQNGIARHRPQQEATHRAIALATRALPARGSLPTSASGCPRPPPRVAAQGGLPCSGLSTTLARPLLTRLPWMRCHAAGKALIQARRKQKKALQQKKKD